ncbi:MAG: ABC transporter ATP-binding protein [Candidatus Gygaella obscura]|nr:ABC transporter ATP-binding protein [Candidatus Gygaella obscura]
MFFEIRNLTVEVESKTIIKDINLSIDKDEVMVLFGPNGSGKTTLLRAIMGFSGYKITKGEIIFEGRKVNNLSIDERAKLGLGIIYQHPARITGVKLHQIARFLTQDESKIKNLAEKLSLTQHLDRDLNQGFSGGEMKRSELFQIILQNSNFLCLDEPESGVDIENISIMGKVLGEYITSLKKSALMITHTGYILDYINAQKGAVMIEGKLWCVGNPKHMFERIKEIGYEKCKDCLIRKSS